MSIRTAATKDQQEIIQTSHGSQVSRGLGAEQLVAAALGYSSHFNWKSRYNADENHVYTIYLEVGTYIYDLLQL